MAPTLFAVPGTVAASPINLFQNGTFTGTSLTGSGGYLCSNGGGSTCTSQITSWQATCAASGCTGSATPSSVMFAGTDGAAWNGNGGLYWNAIDDAPLGGNVVGIDGDTSLGNLSVGCLGARHVAGMPPSGRDHGWRGVAESKKSLRVWLDCRGVHRSWWCNTFTIPADTGTKPDGSPPGRQEEPFGA